MKTFPKSLFASVYASSAVSLTKGLKNAKEYSLIDTLIAAENYSNGHENDTTISSSPSSIFWQSSGELPHVLSFTFHKRVIINVSNECIQDVIVVFNLYLANSNLFTSKIG